MKTTLIKNAIIYDGSGNEPFFGSLFLENEIIRSVFREGDALPMADQTVNAEGKACTPGFIDIHRHADYAVFYGDFGNNELAQGLTSIVNGNCGMSGAPIVAKTEQAIIDYQKPVIGNTLKEIETDTFEAYFHSFEKRSPALNAGMLAGFGTIAGKINGLNGKLKSDSIPAIRKEVEKAVSSGALGISLGLGYQPAFSYSAEDIIACLEPIKDSDVPVTVHMRQEGDGMPQALTEAIEIARRLKVPFEISHLKAIGKRNWNNYMPKALAMLNAARDEGLSLGWDVYPYTAGSTQLMHVLPPEICGRENEFLKDSALYRHAEKRIEEDNDFENIIHLCGFDNIYPGRLSNGMFAPFNGLSLAEGARQAGMPPLRWLLTILAEETIAPSMLDFIVCEADIQTALKDENTVLISDSIYPADGNYHPRVAGTYSRMIEKYVNAENILSLQEAVRRMTSLPAKRMGIRDRGLLRENYKADVCVFNPINIKEKSDYGKPLIPSAGMDRVYVNGRLAYTPDKTVDLHSGKCLRGRF